MTQAAWALSFGPPSREFGWDVMPDLDNTGICAPALVMRAAPEATSSIEAGFRPCVNAIEDPRLRGLGPAAATATPSPMIEIKATGSASGDVEAKIIAGKRRFKWAGSRWLQVE